MEEEIALTSPSTVQDFIDGLDDVDHALPGISPEGLQLLFVQCSTCLAIVAKGSTEWHNCLWGNEVSLGCFFP
jgi:hypothetical protein